MELKLESRATKVLIFAFVEALIVFIFNMVAMFVYIPTKNDVSHGSGTYGTLLNFILVIITVFWIVAIFIASIGVHKRNRKWLVPFIALLYISIIPLFMGLFVRLWMIWKTFEDLIKFEDWYRIEATICIRWDLYVGIFAFIGTGLSIYFVIVLQGYYSELTMELNSIQEPADV